MFQNTICTYLCCQRYIQFTQGCRRWCDKWGQSIILLSFLHIGNNNETVNSLVLWNVCFPNSSMIVTKTQFCMARWALKLNSSINQSLQTSVTYRASLSLLALYCKQNHSVKSAGWPCQTNTHQLGRQRAQLLWCLILAIKR